MIASNLSASVRRCSFISQILPRLHAHLNPHALHTSTRDPSSHPITPSLPALRSPEAALKMERRVRFRRIYLPRVVPRSISLLEFSASSRDLLSREHLREREVIERGELGARSRPGSKSELEAEERNRDVEEWRIGFGVSRFAPYSRKRIQKGTPSMIAGLIWHNAPSSRAKKRRP